MSVFKVARFGQQAPEQAVNDEQELLEKLRQRISKKKSKEPVKEEEKSKKQRKKRKRKETDHEEDTGFTKLEATSQNKAKVRRVLPKWLAAPDVVAVDLGDQQMAVSEMANLDPVLTEALKANDIKYFFPVQRQVIPHLLDSLGKKFYRPSDICVSAPTGSGKTLAFVLPIVQALKQRVVPRVRALILLPVQDLAAQVFKVFQVYSEKTNLRIRLVSGQKSFAQEQSELVALGVDGQHHSLADVIVATPGRIVDHIGKTPGFCLEHLRFLVVDEADRVMEDVQNDWLTHVERAVYSGERKKPGAINCANAMQMELPLQKLLFSATLSQNPEKLQQLSLYEPKLYTSVIQPENILNVFKEEEDEDVFIGKYTTPVTLTESLLLIEDPLKKPIVLANLIKKLKSKKTLVFAKSIESCHYLAVLLQQLGLKVGELSSKLKFKRAKVLSAFKSDKLDIVVCTDALARGIDIGTIEYVVSYDSPQFVKTYIHRIGRTARAGKAGHAVTMLEPKKVKAFKTMLADAGKVSELREETVAVSATDDKAYQDALESAKSILEAEKAAETSNVMKKKKKQRKSKK